MGTRLIPLLSVGVVAIGFGVALAAQHSGAPPPSAALAQTVAVAADTAAGVHDAAGRDERAVGGQPIDYGSMIFVFMLSTFIGLGVIRRVSRLLHTPLMSLTNAISAIAVVGAIIVTGPDYPLNIRIMGVIALFASTTNIVSGFLITDRMLKMFKRREGGAP